jgi:hypothetical protein
MFCITNNGSRPTEEIVDRGMESVAELAGVIGRGGGTLLAAPARLRRIERPKSEGFNAGNGRRYRWVIAQS